MLHAPMVNSKVESTVVDVKNPPEETVEPHRIGLEKKICDVFTENCDLMIAISKAESGMRVDAVSPLNRNGSRDCGLFQINQPSGICPAELLEAEKNLEIARKKFDTQGLGAWYAWRDGKHLKFM